MKNFIILLFLAVVQFGMAQNAKTLRLMSERGFDSVQVAELNKLAEAEKSVLEQRKDKLVVYPLVSLGAQYGFFGTMGSTFTGFLSARTPGIINKHFLVFAGELSLGKNEKMGEIGSIFVGFDIIRSGGCDFIGLSAKNKRQNLPKYAVIHMDWRVGVKHTFVFGASHHGFTSVVSKFAINVTPRNKNGKLSPITFSAGFEVGPYIDSPTYRRDNMHQYLKRSDDWTYFSNRSNWEYNVFEAQFFVGIKASIGHKGKKTPQGYVCPAVF